MGIDNKKGVYLFDQDERRWKCYSHSTDRFVNIFVPFLTDDFAGIGTRNITDDGLQAILDVYEQTLGDVK
jgi:hypothetical protein